MSGEFDRTDPPPLSVKDTRLAEDRVARPWRWRLFMFLRALSAIELVKGLVYWALLIGSGGAAEPLARGSAGWVMTTAFFAVTDPVAAVGLWVGAAWGVAIWLIAALAQLLIIAFGGHVAGGWAIVIVTVAAMAAYVALSLKARREAS